MRGMGRIFQRGRIWHIAYYHEGEEYRESSRSPREADARRLLKQRLRQTPARRLAPPWTINDVLDLVEQDYRLTGELSGPHRSYLKHLREAFGTMRVAAVTTATVKAYIQRRREAGRAPGTINRALVLLKRAYALGKQEDPSLQSPYIPQLPDTARREGFFEAHEFDAIAAHLPVYLRDAAEFAYDCGWRKGEVLALTWANIDLDGREVRLTPEQAKNRTGRVVLLDGPLWDVMQRRRAARFVPSRDWLSPLVFHHDGDSIRNSHFYRAWNRAAQQAGVPHRLFHDFRRTAVRNFSRAGVRDMDEMQITGHKTRHVYDRYNIVSEANQREAMRRLYASQQHGHQADIPGHGEPRQDHG